MITRLHRVILVVCFTALTSVVGWAGQTNPEPIIDISVKIVTEARDHFYLYFTLSNRTEQPMTIASSSLPWRWSNIGVLLLAANEFEKGPLTRFDPAIDESFASSLQTVLPAANLQGRVLLNERFPKLPTLARNTDVIVFWTFVMTSPPVKRDFRRFGGMTVIPKLSLPN